jgi:hypothetical protein
MKKLPLDFEKKLESLYMKKSPKKKVDYIKCSVHPVSTGKGTGEDLNPLDYIIVLLFHY